jgi:eukaryotic-like serine/threonine-protein kinase
MALVNSTRLGPYEIIASLGEGGMGEVYRARDTRLDRTVAIKILPAHFSLDPVRKQRFEREAKIISSLNHPHICVLHDVGSQDGIDYLVMECVEGETLAKRLEKGSLPIEQVLKYGMQIADALGQAHRSGVIHRDLKPGNIMLTPGGAKLLDFGLAKPVAPLANLATATAAARPEAPMTEEGAVVGTFQYMSPEQIEGKDLDGRSDIFSLGAVLYEMVTGKRAFEGKSQLSVASAILDKEPTAISTFKPVTPPALHHAIRRCLAKEREERWQSARDLRAELEWIARDDTGTQAVKAPKSFGWMTWLSALALSGAALFMVGYFSHSVPQAQLIRASLPPPPEAAFTISSSVAGSMAISPDGRLLVLTAQPKGDAPQLWVRSLDTLESRPLAGTQGAFAPFWSPDSKWIAFFSGGKLRKVEGSGGPVETLCDAPIGRGGTWNRDGLILFSPNISQPLYRVADTGGAATPVTQLDATRQEVTHRWPDFLPDGKHYLYFVRAATPAATGVYLGTLGSDQHSQIIASSTNAVYVAPGYLLFGRADVLVAQPFDNQLMQVTGAPVQIAQNVSMMPATNYANFAASQTGTLIYSSGTVEVGRQFYWFDRRGKQVGKLGPPEYASEPQLSPEGKRLALRLWTQPVGNFEVWVYDLARGVHARTSFNALTGFSPVWSPGGLQLAYSHSAPRISGDHLFLLNADGTGREQLLESPFLESIANYPSSWSPDGASLLFDRQDKSGKISVWVLPLGGDRKPYAFVETQFDSQMGMFSPDGHWVAYVSNDSGKAEIYVVPFPGPGTRVRVSMDGGAQPRWRRDGRELFYLSPATEMMAAEVSAGPGDFRVGAVRRLFALSGLGGVPGNLYDVTADGQKFIAVQDLEHTSTVPLTIVINWPAQLKKQ